ncbi:MAG: hypothetical protein WCJ74_03615 [bacterium]
MEKYNIPEKHSLDSMEGAEKSQKAEQKSKNEEIFPEIIEKVIEKVQDIMVPGIGYHSLTTFKNKLSGSNLHKKFDFNSSLGIRYYLDYLPNELLDIFSYGLAPKGFKENKEKYKEFAKSLRSDREQTYPSVWFNITGRSISKEDNEKKYDSNLFGGIAIIFDVPSKESFGKGLRTYPDIKIGQYSISCSPRLIGYLREKYPDIEPNDPRIIDELYERMKKQGVTDVKEYVDKFENSDYVLQQTFTPEGKTRVSNVEGFMTPLRIAPRKFKGLVIDFNKLPKEIVLQEEEIPDVELYDRFHNFSYDKLSEELKKEKIISMVVGAMKEIGRYWPIYDIDGNLLWPQKMTHEEIVKMKEEEKSQA